MKISKMSLDLLVSKMCFLCDFLDSTYHINDGGCCFIAYCIARLLDKDKIPYSVVVYHCDCDNFNELDCSHNHYAICVNNVLINGFEDDDDFTIMDNVTSKDLLNHYKECGWNDYYNKKKNDFLFHTINKFYNDFKKDLSER